MQEELTKLRREVLRRQTSSFRSRSPPMPDSWDGRRQRDEEQRWQGHAQHLQQEVARLRQERDAARQQNEAGRAATSARGPGGEPLTAASAPLLTTFIPRMPCGHVLSLIAKTC